MKTKSNHYNIMKFFATILVVLAHSLRMYTGNGVVIPMNNSSTLILITRFIYSFHMPLFIAISGMVYGLCVEDLEKYDDSILFIKNKSIRLLVPYLFFGFVYVAPIMILFKFSEQSYFEYCLKGILLVKNPRHLWYVVVLLKYI